MNISPLLHSLLAAACLFASTPLLSAAPELTLKENDLWVMAGDSITAQRQHTNFIEAYYRTRFPKLNLRFRNSGIGGNRTGNVLARFDYDVAAWKPTIVSIELGMNDVNGGEDPAAYIQGMRELIGRIRAIKAQPVLISSSPVDDGSKLDAWRSDRCRRLHPYTEALHKLATEEGVVFVDQYHPLLALWGENRAKGAAEAARKNPSPVAPATPAATPAPAPASGKALQPAPPAPPALIPLGGDAVHPGPVGQYTMAATILAGLHAPREVSSATLKANGKVVAAAHCAISGVSVKDGKLSFTRLDESGPWPILPAARNAVQLLPAILDLSQYLLKVEGLAPGKYRVNINGKPAATVEAGELSAGWNVASALEGAMADRATAILNALGQLQTKLNNEWRLASKEKNDEKLAAAQQAVDAADSEIRQLCAPAPWQIEIEKDTH